MPRAPIRIATWLLLAYAAALLAGAAAIVVAKRQLLGLEALPSLAILPWSAAPAAFAAWRVKRARSRGEAWAFVAVEASTIFASAWFWIALVFGKPDALAGLAMIVFPAVQLAALLGFALAVIAVLDLIVARRRPQGEPHARPRFGLLAALATSFAVLALGLAWAFGVIRA